MMKMNYGVSFILFLLPVLLFSYTWTSYGPEDIAINSYAMFGGGLVTEIVCTENGIMINNNEQWVEYSYGSLPCWEIVEIMGYDDDYIVVMGDGTDSDGIYGFDKDTGEFTVYHWLMNPRFIKWCPADTSFYAGGEDGLYKSSDGNTWQNVEYFNQLNCHDMVYWEDNYTVSAGTNTYYSPDAGTTWYPSSSYEWIQDMEYDMYGTLYGIFPDESWSSGLWSSLDYGETWNVEFWSVNLSCVGYPTPGYVFVGWDAQPTFEYGFAMWHSDIQELEFCNEGLGNFYINQITTNPIINTPNVLCCTDDGLWMMTNFTVENDEDAITSPDLQAYNYPNPFNPSTTISFSLPEAGLINLTITDIKGRIVKTVQWTAAAPGMQNYNWDGISSTNAKLPSGIYFYQIESAENSAQGKMLLLK